MLSSLQARLPQSSADYALLARRSGIVLGSCVVLIFTWQHMARTRGWKYRPSEIILSADAKVRWCFGKIGEFIARASNAALPDLGELGKTAEDLVEPTFRLLSAPLQIVIGYWEAASRLSTRPWLIGFSSLTLIAAILVARAMGLHNKIIALVEKVWKPKTQSS